MELILTCVAIMFLIMLSAFFSGSETALTAASRSRMHMKEQEGNARASTVIRLIDRKDKLIGALLLGNNLVNILASALTTKIMLDLYGDSGVAIATFAMTLLVLIFAEVLPKTYALHHADNMAMSIAPVVTVVVFILAPVTNLIAAFVRGLLRLFGQDMSAVSAASHLELLRGAIEMHRGLDEKELEVIKKERDMLRSILDLTDVTVCEVMTHRKNTEMLDASISNKQIIEYALNSRYTRLPIYQDNQDNIVGVMHAKLVLRQLRNYNGDIDNIDIVSMISEPWFIPETTTLFGQLQAFRERREHFAIVVDEYGSFMGVVTLEDILEEIVGDIEDEHDLIPESVKSDMTGEGYIVEGTATIRDLNREFEWNLPDEHYSTLAGLILYESKTLPQVNQKFSYYGFHFEILSRQRNQITSIRVIPLRPAMK